jgi:hypothetical protein
MSLKAAAIFGIVGTAIIVFMQVLTMIGQCVPEVGKILWEGKDRFPVASLVFTMGLGCQLLFFIVFFIRQK